MGLVLQLLDSATDAEQISGAAGFFATYGTLLFLPLLIIVMWFLLIRPQKKREKQVEEMRQAIQVGDEVVTSGGIVGIVVSVKDETILIETGGDRNKIRVMRWAVQDNKTIKDEQA